MDVVVAIKKKLVNVFIFNKINIPIYRPLPFTPTFADFVSDYCLLLRKINKSIYFFCIYIHKELENKILH